MLLQITSPKLEELGDRVHLHGLESEDLYHISAKKD
jgi:hypothetical protein